MHTPIQSTVYEAEQALLVAQSSLHANPSDTLLATIEKLNAQKLLEAKQNYAFHSTEHENWLA